MKSKVKYAPPSIAAIALFLLLFAVSCRETPPPQVTPPVPTVTAQTIARAAEPLVYEYAGQTAGYRNVEVRSRADGILLERLYVEGSYVEEGDVLFKIEPEPYKIAVAKAQAALYNAEKQWLRADQLYGDEIISEAAKDVAWTNYRQAQADLQTAQIQLNYTTVKAPLSGITSCQTQSEGNLVQSGSAASVLGTITQIDPMYVNFSYPDCTFLQQKRAAAAGQLVTPKQLQVEVSLADGTVHPFRGYVDFTASTVDTAISSIPARAVIPNPQGTLLPGQFVRISLLGFQRPDAVIIPEKAIVQGAQGSCVYTLSAKNEVAIRPIVLGEPTPRGRLVAAGLESGDRIITAGMVKVRPGQIVNVELDTSEVSAPSESLCPCCKIKNP